MRGREGAFRNAFLPLIIYGAGRKVGIKIRSSFASSRVWKRLKKTSVFNTSRTFRVLILASERTKKDTLQNAECLVALYVKRQPKFLSKVQKLFSSVRGRGGSLSERFSTFNNIRSRAEGGIKIRSSFAHRPSMEKAQKTSAFNTSGAFGETSI